MTVATETGLSPKRTSAADHTSSYIPSLDGMRIFAFMLVFLSHGGLGDIVPGKLGVTFFFFLSGFLITTLLRREAARTGRISLKDFYLRRTLRIMPPMYLALGLCVIWIRLGWLHDSMTPWGILIQALHLTNYGYILRQPGIPIGTGVFWSLAVEEHFYLLFPLFYIWLRKRNSPDRQAAAMFALCLALLAWRCILIFHFHATERYTGFATDTRIDSILFGCILGVWENPVMDRSRASDRTWKYILFPLGVALLLLTLLVRNDAFRETARYTLEGIGMFPIYVAIVRYPNWFWFRGLNLRWIRFLGVLSYSMYLLHAMILRMAEHVPMLRNHEALQVIASLLATIALSTCVYYAVEKPCLRLRKRFSHG